MNQKSKSKKQTENWQSKSLPNLSEHDSNVALSHENRSWAMNFSKLENIGKIHNMASLGFIIQNSGDYKVRCISVVDHFECRIGLALLKETFDSIRVNFELDHLVVMPFIELEKEQNSEISLGKSQSQDSIYFDVV